MLYTLAEPVHILGWQDAVDGINTLMVLYGTKPPSQLAALFQSLLVPQFQVRYGLTVTGTVCGVDGVPQAAVVAVTLNVPLVAVVLKLTVTLLPVPEIVAPVPE